MSNRLPANIMRMLSSEARKSNMEVIIDYLVSEEGAVTLTEQQQELLKRWNHADDLLRMNRYRTSQVVKILENKHGIAPATAWRDIEAAKIVFGSTRKSNKNYLLALHVDRIQDAIIQAQTQGRLELLPKLFDSYTNASKLLPEDVKSDLRPTAIIFQISQTNITPLIEKTITVQEAEEIAMEVFKHKGIDMPEMLDEDA